MMNTKETLKKLHARFPSMSLEELFNALDCFVEESPLHPSWPFQNDYWKYTPKHWDQGIVYCSEKQSEPNQFCSVSTNPDILNIANLKA